MNIFREEDFYKDNGYPTEEFEYCAFVLPASDKTKFESDYDRFALVVNAFYPYIRLARIIGDSCLPCGLSRSPATDGSFARFTDEERNARCPKVVWGIAAKFIANLTYSETQRDYVLNTNIKEIYKEYYEWYRRIYLSNCTGLKYAGIPVEQKELSFMSQHLMTENELWEKSTFLRYYDDLIKYALNAKTEYEKFVLERKKELQVLMERKNSKFSTEIRSSFDTDYVKVFFLDDSVASKAQEVVQALGSVRIANQTRSNSFSHPGVSLTVYPKPMVTAVNCEREIIESLNAFFSGASRVSVRAVKTDAYFNDIERQIINDLDNARVSIHVAMAWFTNQRIADKLVEKFKEGLDVKVVSFDDHTNARFGVNIDGIPHKIIKGSRGGTMHNKFCVIDNQKVLTGSYNWSENAEKKNDENVPVIYDDARASDYSVEFRRLFGDFSTEN